MPTSSRKITYKLAAKTVSAPSVRELSSDSETEGVGVFFTPSVKTCGFATSLGEGGEAGASITRLPAQTALLLIVFAEVSTGHPRPRPTRLGLVFV